MRTGPRFILEPPFRLGPLSRTRLVGGCFFRETRDSGVLQWAMVDHEGDDD